MQRTNHNGCIQVISVLHNMIYSYIHGLSVAQCFLLIVLLGPGKRTEPIYIYKVSPLKMPWFPKQKHTTTSIRLYTVQIIKKNFSPRLYGSTMLSQQIKASSHLSIHKVLQLLEETHVCYAQKRPV